MFFRDYGDFYKSGRSYKVEFENDDYYFFKLGTRRNSMDDNLIDYGISKSDENKKYVVHVEE